MRCAVFLLNGVCDKKTENRHQRTDIRRQKSEIRNQKTDVRNQQTENGNQKTEDRKRMSEIREQISEDRKQKSEIRNQISRLWAVICLRVSDPRLPAVFLFPRAEVFRNMLGNDPLCVSCPCIER